MAELIHLRWPGLGDGTTRRERTGCEYDAYLPDLLAGREFTLRGDVAADIADAEAEIARFNARSSPLSDTEGLARLLLRAEAVASSRIEGLVAGPRRVLRAEAAQRIGVASLDVGADEILGNIRAMHVAVASAAAQEAITPAMVIDVHRELLRSGSQAEHGGRIREEQNWIGGNAYNPCGAAYVPPPDEHVEGLIADLCQFASGTDLSPLAQAGIAHAQFETIHPFVDGNGRTGRALIHMVLRRRGLAPRFVPPISLVLATTSRQYVRGLTSFRHIGPANSAAAHDAANEWLGVFATATLRALREARGYEDAIDGVRESWGTRLGVLRANSAAELLLQVLVAAPVVTVQSAAGLIGRSFEATNLAVGRLVQADILRPITVGRRNRAFEAAAIIDAIVGLERRLLGSPIEDFVGPNNLEQPPSIFKVIQQP